MKRDSYESIESTKKGFEESFKTGTFYNKQTQDQKHLELILNCMNVSPGIKFLISAQGQAIWLFPLPGNILRQKLPEITDAFHEIHRVLKPDGNFFLSDPAPNEKDAPEFDQIVHRFDPQVTAGYDIEITKDEIWITEKVNNLLFHKIKNEEEYL